MAWNHQPVMVAINVQVLDKALNHVDVKSFQSIIGKF